MVRQLDSPIRAKKRPDHIASARQPFVTFAYGIHSSRAREAIAKLHEELHTATWRVSPRPAGRGVVRRWEHRPHPGCCCSAPENDSQAEGHSGADVGHPCQLRTKDSHILADTPHGEPIRLTGK